MSLTDDDVTAAFRWLLGRAPEDSALQWHKTNFQTVNELRRHLLNSTEFLNSRTFNLNKRRPLTLSFLRPRIVFLHIPKTGGTSLTHMLDAAFQANEIFPDRFAIGHHPAEFLAQFRFFRGHYTRHEIALLPAPTKIITVVREPRQRLISLYRFHKALIRQRSAVGSDILLTKAELPYRHYLSDPEVRAHPGINNAATRNLFALDSTVPEELRQAAAAEYAAGRVRSETRLAVAYAVLDAMAWVSTMEGLATTVPLLGPALGLNLDLSRLSHRKMVTDRLADEDPGRFSPSVQVTRDDEIEALMDDLVALDEAVYRHVQSRTRESIAEHGRTRDSVAQQHEGHAVP